MPKYELYDGRAVMEYDPIAHAYKINDIVCPSVTKITGVIDKPALVYWAVNETAGHIIKSWRPGIKYTQAQINAIVDDAKSARFRSSGRALNIGSEAHDWIERWIKAKVLGYDEPSKPDFPPVVSAVSAFLSWAHGEDVEFISSERKVCSLKHMYTGTADCDLILDGKRYVADLKTSKAIYPEYFIQCSAYAAAMSEEDGTKYDGVMIIRIPKASDDSLEVQTAANIEELQDVFLSCLNVWRWKNEQP